VKKGDIHQINDLAMHYKFDGINLQKDNGETALVQAVRNRDIFFTEGLLKMDANPNVKDHAGRPVFLMPWSLFEMNPKLRSEVIRKEGEYVLEMSLLLLAHSKSCGNKPTLKQGLTNIK
jgi:ankyrin repeat protein